jgi:hypothetical protein
VSRETLGSLPWRSRSQHDLAAKSSPVHNFVIWGRILQLFHKNDHLYWDNVSRATFRSLPWRSRSQHDLAAKSSTWLRYLKSDFTTISQKWSPYWDNVSRTTLGLILHFELCLWQNSDTTRGIPSCVQNLIRRATPGSTGSCFKCLEQQQNKH